LNFKVDKILCTLKIFEKIKLVAPTCNSQRYTPARCCITLTLPCCMHTTAATHLLPSLTPIPGRHPSVLSSRPPHLFFSPHSELLLPLLLAAAAPVTRRAASSVEPRCCLLAEHLAEPRYRLRSAAVAVPLPRRLLRAEVAAYTNARALPRHRCSPEFEPPLRRATASAPS
jgi:hypothetical protein